MGTEVRPQIIFALVTRGPQVVLADYSGLSVTGNFEAATRQFVTKINPSEEWKSYICGDQAFHYFIDGDLWFVCMADKAMERRLPFGFMAAVQEAFKKRYDPQTVAAAPAHGMNVEFRETIRELMNRYNSPDADRVASMTEKVQHINQNLVESIDKLLDREEKIHLLINRSEMLSQSSESFHRDSRQLHRNVRWRNLRTHIILAVVIVVGILIVVWVSCGLKFDRC